MWGSLKWHVTALQRFEGRAAQERQVVTQQKEAAQG